ncbi:hypothetical protein LIER_17309 [Lithospermum erythrorhizon]|uniref:Uncharacterized protein n=1 Tax=Lithospermum erythrorhizon TaxID=34254 RepID=A0AAV3Q9U3_LITER
MLHNVKNIRFTTQYHNTSFKITGSSFVAINATDGCGVPPVDDNIDLQFTPELDNDEVPIRERTDTFVNINEYTDARTIILPKVPPCKYCGAYKFFKETDHMCCSKGEISLAESILPSYLVSLITRTDSKSKEFQNMIRTYNNHFAFTSIGTSKRLSGIQFYFNDPEHQVSNRMEACPRLDMTIAENC